MKFASPIQIVTGGDMSSSITSEVVPLDQIFGFSIQADYSTSGTLAGTLALQGSTDHLQDSQGNILMQGTFVDIAGSSVPIMGAGHWVWNATSSMYPYVRLAYAPGVGDSGTLNAYASVKGV